jgi:hypothetical protein
MPTSAEHTIRIREGMLCIAYLSNGLTQSFDAIKNSLAIEYFYTNLHMLEATIYDLHALFPQRHFASHKARSGFLQSIPATHLLSALGPAYESLRGISEQGRYLSPSRTHNYQPITKADLQNAQVFYQVVKTVLENVYVSYGKKAPWIP